MFELLSRETDRKMYLSPQSILLFLPISLTLNRLCFSCKNLIFNEVYQCEPTQLISMIQVEIKQFKIEADISKEIFKLIYF